MTRLMVGLCWMAVAGHGAAVGYSYHGATGFISTIMVAMLPLAMVASTATVIAAAGLQRLDLLLAAVVVLVCSLVSQGTTTTAAHAAPHPAALAASSSSVVVSHLGGVESSAELSVVSSNVRAGNPRLIELVAELAVGDPDVVVLLEIQSAELARLLDSPLAMSHPHVIADPRDGYFGSAVFSRVPIRGQAVQIGGYPMIEATVDAAGGPIDLIAVHVAAPLGELGHELWTDQLAALRHRLDTANTPLIIVGDFNATPQHKELRMLAGPGSTRGLGVVRSYPANAIVPPLLSLDHAFAAGGACIAEVMPMADTPGSDHLAQWVEVGYSSNSGCRY